MSPFQQKLLFRFILLPLLILPFAANSQECEKVKLTDFPKKDLPKIFDSSQAKRAELKEKGSYNYYYGIGVPVDYIRARQLAFIEMAINREDEVPFAGASVLMMLYANGFGVKRDLAISIRLACANVGFSDAEIEGRVEHLKKLQSGDSTGVFDLCDDITSGYMSGYCESVRSELAEQGRKSAVDSVIKGWPEKDRIAYGKLRAAASGFFTQRVLSEVDMSGTARAAMEIGESESLEEGFKQQIVDADKCAFTTASPQQFEKADKQLNEIYKKIMNIQQPQWGTVTKESIRSAQRSWIKYRDAWVVFGAVRCPQLTETSWKTLITTERIGQLQAFLEEFE